jgi:inhibitor of cysteine peptidase
MIVLMLIMSIISITIFSGCLQQDAKTIAKEKTPANITDIIIPGSTQELKKFSSAHELRDYLKASAVDTGAYGLYRNPMIGGSGLAIPVATAVSMPSTVPMPPGAMQKGAAENIQAPSSASDYSTTNIQVEGVDEADFVKNDGKYIYVIAQDKVLIVDAFPASGAKILSAISVEGVPRDIFINGDRLIIFSDNTGRVYSIPEYDYMPRPIDTMKTEVLIYDMADRKKPEEIANYSINGNYFQSRMIGDYVYFIAKNDVYYTNDLVEMPAIRKGAVKIMSPDVYYFDNPEQNYVFHTIASINIKNPGSINAKTFMMGYSDNFRTYAFDYR